MASRSATQNSSTSLDANAWIDAGFDALAEGGIDAVRVDPLAKKLGVTRGSFYWHFVDRAALHQAMLKEWRKRASYRIGSRIETRTPDPHERLKQTLALPNSTPRAKRAAAIELAIRLWAQRDAQATRAVRHIDRVRLNYYAKLFSDKGLAQAEARKRAYLLYASLLAQAYINTDDETDVSAELANMLLGD